MSASNERVGSESTAVGSIGERHTREETESSTGGSVTEESNKQGCGAAYGQFQRAAQCGRQRAAQREVGVSNLAGRAREQHSAVGSGVEQRRGKCQTAAHGAVARRSATSSVGRIASEQRRERVIAAQRKVASR